MTREFQAGRSPSANPATAALTRNHMADYARLCEVGENLERAAARWAREQAQRDLPARRRRGGGRLLAAIVIGLTITLVGVLVSPRRSGRPCMPLSGEA